MYLSVHYSYTCKSFLVRGFRSLVPRDDTSKSFLFSNGVIISYAILLVFEMFDVNSLQLFIDHW